MVIQQFDPRAHLVCMTRGDLNILWRSLVVVGPVEAKRKRETLTPAVMLQHMLWCQTPGQKFSNIYKHSALPEDVRGLTRTREAIHTLITEVTAGSQLQPNCDSGQKWLMSVCAEAFLQNRVYCKCNETFFCLINWMKIKIKLTSLPDDGIVVNHDIYIYIYRHFVHSMFNCSFPKINCHVWLLFT